MSTRTKEVQTAFNTWWAEFTKVCKDSEAEWVADSSGKESFFDSFLEGTEPQDAFSDAVSDL